MISSEENVQAGAASGPLYALEDVMAELGITPSDLERQGQEDEIVRRPR